jgi:hypothetical protein
MNKATCWNFRSRQRITRRPGSVRSARRVVWGCSGLGTGSGSGSCITGSRWRSRASQRAHPHCAGAARHPVAKFPRVAASLSNGVLLVGGAAGTGERKARWRDHHGSAGDHGGPECGAGIRESTVGTSDIADAIDTLGAELAAAGDRPAPAFHVTVEGESRPLHPILRDDIYKITAEALRNAFRHAEATDVDVETPLRPPAVPVTRAG